MTARRSRRRRGCRNESTLVSRSRLLTAMARVPGPSCSSAGDRLRLLTAARRLGALRPAISEICGHDDRRPRRPELAGRPSRPDRVTSRGLRHAARRDACSTAAAGVGLVACRHECDRLHRAVPATRPWSRRRWRVQAEPATIGAVESARWRRPPRRPRLAICQHSSTPRSTCRPISAMLVAKWTGRRRLDDPSVAPLRDCAAAARADATVRRWRTGRSPWIARRAVGDAGAS